MSTNSCLSFGAAPWEYRYFSRSPFFIGLKCVYMQASTVSVCLSALTFLLVLFVVFCLAFVFFCFRYLFVVQ